MSLNQVVLYQMLYQRRKGHQVSALCPDDLWAESLKQNGIKVWDVPFARHKVFSTILALIRTWRICRRERFDVVHTHNSLPGVAGRVAARLARIPVVVHTCHAWPLHQSRGRVATWGYETLERFAARMAHAVLFQNPDDMSYCRDKRIVAARKCVLIGNGIDIASFTGRVSRNARAKIRKELGIPDDVAIIVVIARLEMPKGHFALLRAIKRLTARSRCRAVTLLVGLGIDSALIRSEWERLALGQSVRFLGYREDVPDILAASDVSALTSRFEGIPRALMESMALGLPIVATDVPGSRSLVQHEVTGLLVPYNDVPSIADALARLLEDRVLAASFGEAGRKRIIANFDERPVADRIQSIYDQIAAADAAELPSWQL